MRILVTRPLEDANATAEKLTAHGHEAITSPLLTITEFSGEALDLTGVQAILATSANGVRALGRRTAVRNIPVFAVGPQTAREARDAGFTIVRDADGDATALAEAVTQWTLPDRGSLLHASGLDGVGRLAGLLEGRGFEVRTETLYAVSAAPLTPKALTALESGGIDAVMLYSPRTARLFRDIVLGENLGDRLNTVIAICISPAAASALAPLVFAETRIASAPNQDALLACTD